MALCWLWASEGSCWQFPFSDLSAKPPPSCSPGRRGQVSGYWDGKGLESLRQVRVACVELIRRLPLQRRQARGQICRRLCTPPTFFRRNPPLSPKTCDILELQFLSSEQFIWGSSMPHRRAREKLLCSLKKLQHNSNFPV